MSRINLKHAAFEKRLADAKKPPSSYVGSPAHGVIDGENLKVRGLSAAAINFKVRIRMDCITMFDILYDSGRWERRFAHGIENEHGVITEVYPGHEYTDANL